MTALGPSRIAAAAAVVLVVLLVGWNSFRSERSERGFPTGAGTGSGPDPGGAGAPTGSGGPGALRISGSSRVIVVDVSGAVRRPGVYRFEDGDRVIDAIRRAGGATRRAFAAGINRAALLADGQQVVVPLNSLASRSGAASSATAVPGSPAVPGAAAAPISLGTATAADLDQIEGIGPVTAAAILEFRDSQGGVSSIDELDQVSGIGPVTMEALRSQLQP
jgi:competence protein ComEA